MSTYVEVIKQLRDLIEKDLMTGRCKRCKEVNKLYERPDGNYCYDCKRVTPIPKPVEEPKEVKPGTRKIKGV